MELQVFAVNEAPIHIYEKFGFKRFGIVPGKILLKGRLVDEICVYVDLRQRVAPETDPQTGAAKHH